MTLYKLTYLCRYLPSEEEFNFHCDKSTGRYTNSLQIGKNSSKLITKYAIYLFHHFDLMGKIKKQSGIFEKFYYPVELVIFISDKKYSNNLLFQGMNKSLFLKVKIAF